MHLLIVVTVAVTILIFMEDINDDLKRYLDGIVKMISLRKTGRESDRKPNNR